MTTASLRYALLPLRYGSALRPEGSVAGFKGLLPPAPFPGACLLLDCDCWRLVAGCWLVTGGSSLVAGDLLDFRQIQKMLAKPTPEQRVDSRENSTCRNSIVW